MSRLLRSTKGQVIIGVALALFAMFGLLGLVFDLGWSFYLEKETQTAADAAAMATALEVLDTFGPGGGYDCTDPAVFCGSATACPSTPAIGALAGSSLDAGCVYARRNGYWLGNPDRDQNVRIAAGSAGAGGTVQPPAAPGVNVFYWATAMVAEETPQIFSAILGNAIGISSSSATAAIVESIIPGSLWLLNREDDCIDMPQNGDCGVNLFVNSNRQGCSGQNCAEDGDYSLRVAGRVLASSQRDGSGPGPDDFAAAARGNARILSDEFRIRGTGNYNSSDPLVNPYGNGCNNCEWDAEPRNGGSGPDFLDPTRGKTNPPLPDPANATDFGLRGYPGGDVGVASLDCDGDGTLPANTIDDPLVLGPGIYYSFRNPGNSPPTADGEAIFLGGSTNYYQFGCSGTSFGEYVFLGGLEIGANTHVKFGPGRYVYGGTSANNGSGGHTFQVHAGAYVTDGYGHDTGNFNQAVPDGHAGQIHILAGPNYTAPRAGGAGTRTLLDLVHETIGLYGGQLTNDIPNLITDNKLTHGSASIQLGRNPDGSFFNVHGLNPDGTDGNSDNVPPELDDSNPASGASGGHRKFAFWQDRDNSIVGYDPLDPGAYDCPGDPSFVTCTGGGTGDPSTTELEIHASPDLHIYGVVYQPRGAYAHMTGGGDYSGPLQIVTGAMQITGDAVIDLGILPEPITTRIVALVQ